MQKQKSRLKLKTPPSRQLHLLAHQHLKSLSLRSSQKALLAYSVMTIKKRKKSLNQARASLKVIAILAAHKAAIVARKVIVATNAQSAVIEMIATRNQTIAIRVRLTKIVTVTRAVKKLSLATLAIAILNAITISVITIVKTRSLKRKQVNRAMTIKRKLLVDHVTMVNAVAIVQTAIATLLTLLRMKQ